MKPRRNEPDPWDSRLTLFYLFGILMPKGEKMLFRQRDLCGVGTSFSSVFYSFSLCPSLFSFIVFELRSICPELLSLLSDRVCLSYVLLLS